MASVQLEIKFAQSLAGNEKKYRDKALKKLKKFLKAKSSMKKDGFTSEDFLKLWKGLHYCMWMQDKAVVQEELSSNLSKLVHELSCIEAQMLFVRVFYMTEAREWNGIDVWRIDKFMMLVRNMLNEALVVLKKNKWKESLIWTLNQIHIETLMHPTNDSLPDGLRIHLTDIYLDEVEKVGQKQLDGPKLLLLLEPFINFIKKAPKSSLVKRVVDRVFQPIIDRALQVYLRNNNRDEVEEEEDIPYWALKFDTGLIADHIFKIGQGTDVLERNRPVLYSIVTELRDAMSGVIKDTGEEPPEDISHREISRAVNSLVSMESKIMKKDKKKKKKDKKKKAKEGKENQADSNNNSPSVYITSAEPAPSTSNHTSKQPWTTSTGKSDKTTDIPSSGKVSEPMPERLNRKRKMSDDANAVVETNSVDTDVGSKKVQKGGKRSLSQPDNVEVPEVKVPKINIEDTTVSIPNAAGDAGAVSINGKNKKIKDKSPRKAIFAKFDKSKPPPAFLKKSLVKAAVMGRCATPIATSVDVNWETPSSQTKTPKTDSNTPKPASNSPKAASNTLNSASNTPKAVVETLKPISEKLKHASDGQKSASSTPKPSSKISESVSKTPRSAKKTPRTSQSKTPGSSKRVSFDMKKNTCQAFKESTIKPVTPFNPKKKPDQGILKTPSENVTPTNIKTVVASSSAASSTSSSTSGTGQKRVTRVSISTPKSVGSRPTPSKRMRAADFFL